ncbi:MAG: hypothetical protein CMH83_21810 [Nocardioides sp.]|nr:hypothetical protein [Nocardioides sp.]
MSAVTTTVATTEPTQSAAQTAARPRAWAGRQGLAAVAVLLVTVAWRGRLLADSFFNQDDFYLSGRAGAASLDLSFLVRDTAGHVNPAQQLVYWLVAHGSPYSWGVVGTFVLGMQLLASVLMWLVLSRLLPGRWARVPLLAAFCWSPLTLATTLWWSAAMGLWPHVACSLAAVLFLLRARSRPPGDRWRHVDLALVVLACLVGLLWHERSVLVPPVVLAAAVCLVDDPAARGWRRLPAAVKELRWLWVALVGLLGAYLVAHSMLTSVEGGGTSLRTTASISWAFVGENVVPGIASGPWDARLEGGAVLPAPWVVVASWLVVAAVWGLLLWRGGPARRWALAFLVAYVAADLALVLAGRGGFGRLIGLDPRYSSDAIHVAVLAVALALRGAPRHLGWAPERWLPGRLRGRLTWRRLRTTVVAAAVAAYGLGALAGSAVLVPHFQNTEDRQWLTGIRASLAADPTQVIVDDLAPADVVLPLVGNDSLLSRVLAPLPEDVAVDEASPRLRVVADDGTLLEPVLAQPVVTLPGPVEGCGHPVTREPRRIRFGLPLRGRVLVRVGYYTSDETPVEVSTGGSDPWTGRFLARPGPNIAWLVVPDVGYPVTGLTMHTAGPGTVCVPQAAAGLPEAP